MIWLKLRITKQNLKLPHAELKENYRGNRSVLMSHFKVWWECSPCLRSSLWAFLSINNNNTGMKRPIIFPLFYHEVESSSTRVYMKNSTVIYKSFWLTIQSRTKWQITREYRPTYFEVRNIPGSVVVVFPTSSVLDISIGRPYHIIITMSL